MRVAGVEDPDIGPVEDIKASMVFWYRSQPNILTRKDRETAASVG